MRLLEIKQGKLEQNVFEDTDFPFPKFKGMEWQLYSIDVLCETICHRKNSDIIVCDFTPVESAKFSLTYNCVKYHILLYCF